MLILQLVSIFLVFILLFRVYIKHKKNPIAIYLYLLIFFLMHLLSLIFVLIANILGIFSIEYSLFILLVFLVLALFTSNIACVSGYIFSNVMLESEKSYFSKRINFLFILALIVIFFILSFFTGFYFDLLAGTILLFLELLFGTLILINIRRFYLKLTDQVARAKCKLLMLGFACTQIISSLIFIFIVDYEVTSTTEFDPVILIVFIIYYVILTSGFILIESSYRI